MMLTRTETSRSERSKREYCHRHPSIFVSEQVAQCSSNQSYRCGPAYPRNEADDEQSLYICSKRLRYLEDSEDDC
jgi:hypothetical protein